MTRRPPVGCLPVAPFPAGRRAGGALAALLPTLSILLAACGSLAPMPTPRQAPPTLSDGPSTVTSGSSPERSPGQPPEPLPEPLPEPPPKPPPRDARLGDPALVETSGLAVSRRDPGVLWAVNDGGHAPALHAMTFDGRPLGRWPLDVGNRDWEDLAAFRLDGEPWLLVADTGDNLRRRDEVVLHLVAEPVPRGPGAAPGTTLTPRRSLRFRYEDGPRDVEAVAVDETSATVWLLPKAPVASGRGVAGGAYSLSLRDDPDDGTPLPARRAATLAEVSRGLAGRLAAALAGVDLAQPTAFDIAADGRTGCLLTYRRVRCFERADGEDWSETLARPGRALRAHGLDQAEALALSANGSLILFTSEGASPPLRARRLPRP